MHPNIAFLGKAGAGKDTAADLMIQAFDYRRLSFAGKHEGGLRDVAVRIWGSDAENDRDKLQALGHTVRQIDEDAWVNAALRTLRRVNGGLCYVDTPPVRDPEVGIEAAFHSVVVTDCRYPNEAWRLSGDGFITVRVHAERSRRISRLQANGKLGQGDWENHESETALDTYVPDYSVQNDEDPADLFTQLVSVLAREQRRA